MVQRVPDRGRSLLKTDRFLDEAAGPPLLCLGDPLRLGITREEQRLLCGVDLLDASVGLGAVDPRGDDVLNHALRYHQGSVAPCDGSQLAGFGHPMVLTTTREMAHRQRIEQLPRPVDLGRGQQKVSNVTPPDLLEAVTGQCFAGLVELHDPALTV